MKCSADIHVPQGLNCNFGNPLIFHLGPSSGQTLDLSNIWSKYLHSHLPQLLGAS